MTLVMVTGAALSVSPASGGEAVAFEIDALHSGKAMDVEGASDAAGARVVQWTPHGGDNQAWRAVLFSTVGDLDLVILQSVRSGLVLDVADRSRGRGAELIQTDWAAEVNQLWVVLPFGETDLSLIINVSSEMVADVAGASTANGAPIIQWPWHGGANQLWAFLV